jgi:ribonuclease BN (tRNA processing enzyme)
MGMSLSVTMLGVGNAFTTRSFHTSFVMEGGGAPVLVDCPSPIGRMLREAGMGLKFADLEHVVITHIHVDHIGGLEEFLYGRRYVENCAVRPHLYTLEENIGPLWDRRLALSFGDTFDATKAGTGLEDLFEVHAIVPGEPMTIGGMEFEFRRTGHSIPTVGFVARAGGSCIGYSADATFDPELVAFLAQADLFFHEGGDGAAHTPLESLAQLPADVRRRMRVVHLPDSALEGGLPEGLVAARVGKRYGARV